MKVAILAGGFGSRLGEETELRPKPMVEIGGQPILWHIMKYYAHYGFTEFVILLGYKAWMVKDYFVNYFLYRADCTIDLGTNGIEYHQNESEKWRVTLVDTGLNTMTGGRLKRAEKYLRGGTFMLTYGDGVANVELDRLLRFHESHGRTATMTTVRPAGRFGAVEIAENGQVASFVEKPKNGGWVNGGFFVCEPTLFDFLPAEDSTVFEHGPLERLAEEGELFTYKHHGFWQCMDTARDKSLLAESWSRGDARWKVW